MTVLFYPDLINLSKEWEINDGRRRVDIVYANSADHGFFAQRRDDKNMQANMVIVECKNYSEDIANPELDQLLGRFDGNRGKFGIVACRTVDKPDVLARRCKDASSRKQGYILVMTDEEFKVMLDFKSKLKDKEIEKFLFGRLGELLK